MTHSQSYWMHLAKWFGAMNGVGWLDPTGYVYTVDRWEHMKFFIENDHSCPEVTDILKPAWDEFLEPYLEKHRNEDRRWHEWVDPIMSLDDEIIARARSVAYENGWGRMAPYGGDKIELECFEGHRAKLTKHARQLAEVMGRELLVTVQEPYPKDSEQKPHPSP
jgi:hypothetical protein